MLSNLSKDTQHIRDKGKVWTWLLMSKYLLNPLTGPDCLKRLTQSSATPTSRPLPLRWPSSHEVGTSALCQTPSWALCPCYSPSNVLEVGTGIAADKKDLVLSASLFHRSVSSIFSPNSVSQGCSMSLALLILYYCKLAFRDQTHKYVSFEYHYHLKLWKN